MENEHSWLRDIPNEMTICGSIWPSDNGGHQAGNATVASASVTYSTSAKLMTFDPEATAMCCLPSNT